MTLLLQAGVLELDGLLHDSDSVPFCMASSLQEVVVSWFFLLLQLPQQSIGDHLNPTIVNLKVVDKADEVLLECVRLGLDGCREVVIV